MSIRTLVLFLIGERQAILTLASDRRALWVGLLFVLSAGFAREYDGHSLLHEPWHLFVPLAASLGSSLLLFSLLYFRLIWTDQHRPRYFTAYRSFLTLFWMTAPLAWLYAVPYERFMTPEGAMTANLTTLGVVAAWRVVLMVRVARVLMGYGFLSSVFLVMTFADTVALIGLLFLPGHLFQTMGGVRLTNSERVLAKVAGTVECCGSWMLPLWLLGGFFVLRNSEPEWQHPPTSNPGSGPSRAVWVLAVASLAVWGLVLPWTQPEQLLRWEVESKWKMGYMETALDMMSSHAREDFPPHWEPPITWRTWNSRPGMIDAMEAIIREPPAPWVREFYVAKFREYLVFHPGHDLRTAKVILALPEGPTLAPDYWRDVKKSLKQERERQDQERKQWSDLLDEADRKGYSLSP